MRQIFETIFNNFIRDLKSNKSPKKNLESVKAIEKDSIEAIKKTGLLHKNSKDIDTYKFCVEGNCEQIEECKYLVEGSCGTGGWTYTPWIAIFRKTETESAQRGIYVVYLFNKECNKVYLTLNQGSTSIGKVYKPQEATNILIKNAELWRNLLAKYNNNYFVANNDINLDEDSNPTAKAYKDGTIFYKEYEKGKLPSNETIISDLAKMLEIYEKFVDIRLHLYDKINLDTSENNPPKVHFEVSSKNKPFNMKKFSTPYAERYVKSLLAKQFVILTGNSGTGKTNIAKNFAKWLEKKDDKGNTNYLIKAVGADWTDNTKVLGYFNPIANNGRGEYVSTDILNLIINANNNPDIPFFLILDEMNLSHVERYFSDFLSAMESKEDIILYKKPRGCLSVIDEKISIPDNLFITGTVNIDETTYMFSPKVLDRANVIEFIPDEKSIFRALEDTSEINKSFTIEPDNSGMAEAFLALSKDIKNKQQTSLNKDYGDVLKKFNQTLKAANFDFAYRTVKEIVYYYFASKEVNPKITDDEIIDEQIVQKILPKIHGNKKQLGNLLDNLEKLCIKSGDKKGDIVGTGWNLGKDLSLTKIALMKKRLETMQYTSFI
ncbi:MrcB family domain-containing protein [Treponema bryantii]|uniref:MrcB family domain-containing protein n=1 Tax=Treponema bryantii TaxID=163 RepID=UPI0003B61802|nr:DUF3578 domain-containing protein [Treponema bryantii]